VTAGDEGSRPDPAQVPPVPGLCCPDCGGPLVAAGAALQCRREGVPKAVQRDGVIDFVAAADGDRGGLAGFGYQWARVLPVGADTEEAYGNRLDDLVERIPRWLGLAPGDLRRARVADIGCGHGLYARALAALGARVAAVDLSGSVYGLARTPVRGAPLDCIRADVFRLPLEEGAFDVVLAFGMVHHTAAPRRALEICARRLAPGGRLLAYVYEPWRVGHVSLRRLFPLPSRLPPPVLHAFCRVAALPLLALQALLRRRLPTGRAYRNMVLGLFDAYSPRHVFTFPAAEVMGWLRAAGLEEVRRVDRCTYVARRPADPVVSP